jgi:hypothetical protein
MPHDEHEAAIISRMAARAAGDSNTFLDRLLQRARHNCAEGLKALLEQGDLQPNNTVQEAIEFLERELNV